tara:strand:+ start:196 stop:645 length:450 start_codon:yes stop_codon:yes gene_type:complete
MATDTYQKTQRQRREYNLQMNKLEESKATLKYLYKQTSIDSKYLANKKQFNLINAKLADEKDTSLSINDVYHKLKQMNVLKYENQTRISDIYINNREQFNELFYLKLKNGRYMCVYKPSERLNMINLKNKYYSDKNQIIHLEQKIRRLR